MSLKSSATAGRANAHRLVRITTFGFLALAMLLVHRAAEAVDGCMVILCLAAPKWREVPMCVPVIHQLHRDLARGRPFPVCNTAGPNNWTENTWASAPGNCPEHYTRLVEGPNRPMPVCDYAGVVTVYVNGAPFTRTWWNADADSVTEFTPAAKAQLGTWDPKFDDDHALWLALQPPPPPACPPLC